MVRGVTSSGSVAEKKMSENQIGVVRNARRDPLEIELIKRDDPLGLPFNAMPLDGLLAIYRNPSLPIPLRFKAMAEAAKYMHPRMGIQVYMDENSFAGRLERAIERATKVKQGQVIMNGGGKLIEAKPEGFRRRI
jgi:hypothetical protein